MLMRSLVEDFLRHISGPVGVRMRQAYYRRMFQSCGARLRIEPGAYISGTRHISVGDDVWIDKMAVLIAGPPAPEVVAALAPETTSSPQFGRITLGNRAHLGIGTIIQGHGGVEIGDDFTTSAHAVIYSMSNAPLACRDGTMRVGGAAPGYAVGTVSIGRNVWLGVNVSVFNASIGSDCFIKAGSVVSEALPENSMAEGSPARRYRARFT